MSVEHNSRAKHPLHEDKIAQPPALDENVSAYNKAKEYRLSI